MTTEAIIGLVLGSNIIQAILNYVLNRKYSKAGTIKLKNEAGQIILEGELRVAQFYQQEWEKLRKEFTELQDRFDKRTAEHQNCEKRLTSMEESLHDIQRQFTLFKSQASGT